MKEKHALRLKLSNVYRNGISMILMSFFLVFSSCEKEELEFEEASYTTADLSTVTVGANQRVKVENPYTISNMQKALNAIKLKMGTGAMTSSSATTSSMVANLNISANVLYMQFTPQTAEQEGILKNDSTLVLIDYPLGYEYGEEYLDNRPPLKEGEIPTYYTTVTNNNILPKGVPYEILEKMYLPQEDAKLINDGSEGYLTISGKQHDFVNVLLEQALLQTNNIGLDGLGMTPYDPGAGDKFLGIGLGKKWRPEGTLKIWDSKIASGSYIPLVGAQVLLRDTFTVGNAITNSSGSFSFGKCRGQKRYIIQWERYQYSIRDGRLFQAEYRGPKRNSRWDFSIKGGETEYFANIHRGAQFYYYENFGGIRRPPNNFTNRQTKIAAVNDCCSGVNEFYAPYLTNGIWPTITIKNYGLPAFEIIGTTIHEIAHSTHAANGVLIFPVSEKRMRETYALTVEWYLTTLYYKTKNPNFVYKEDFQKRTASGSPVYTTFMIDILDDFDQRVKNGAPFPKDRVKNYSIREVENMVMNNATFSGFKDDLKRVYNNPTEIYLDELRANW